MIDIRALTSFDVSRFVEIASGYTSPERYSVRKDESDECATFIVELETLNQPFTKRWEWEDAAVLHDRYRQIIVEHGLSFGAYEGDRLIGVAIAERRIWNQSLWVWEFHVDAGYYRRGIGRRLMDALVDEGGRADLCSVVCETQNTNVPAIRFYRSVGFELDGIVFSFYPPEMDEVAFFMTRRLSRTHAPAGLILPISAAGA